VLLYLPALGLAFAQRGALWRALLPLPAFRILLLLAWAVLSLLWAPLHRPEDEVGRLLSVLAFVLGWQIWTAGDEQRSNRRLLLAGLGIAFFSLLYCGQYLIAPPADGRMVGGDGVIATANYAAAVMGAACVWLCQLLPTRNRTEDACDCAASLVGVGAGHAFHAAGGERELYPQPQHIDPDDDRTGIAWLCTDHGDLAAVGLAASATGGARAAVAVNVGSTPVRCCS
jgi:hypothetical protein